MTEEALAQNGAAQAQDLRGYTSFLRREMPSWLELVLVALLFALSNIAGILFQPLIADNGGRGVDGVHYYNMAQQIAQGRPITDNAPFVYRVATPFLAALLAPDNLILGFKLVNIVAGAFASVLFWVWLRLYIRSWPLRLLLSALFITWWLEPIRYNYFSPVMVDPWFYPIALAGLILLRSLERDPRRATLLVLTLLTFVGVFFREVALLLPIALLGSKLIRLTQRRKQPEQVAPFNSLLFVLPLLAGIAAIALTRVITTASGSYSFISAVIHWSTHKNPLDYAYAWAIAFGPVLIVPLFNLRRVRSWLGENISAGLYFLMIVVVAVVGGANTERFAYWAMPVVYVLAGVVLESTPRIWKTPLLLIVLGAAQLLVQFHIPG